MTSASNDYTNCYRPITPLERARASRMEAEECLKRAHNNVHHHMRVLFGHTVAEALQPDLEVGIDSGDDAFRQYEVAVTEAVEQGEKRIYHLEMERNSVLAHLHTALTSEKSRAVKEGRPVDEWATAAAAFTGREL